MSIYFTVTEIVDVYGTYILIFIFIGLMILKRNYLLSVFSTTKITLESVKTYANNVKLLNITGNTYRNLTLKLSITSKKFINKFKS